MKKVSFYVGVKRNPFILHLCRVMITDFLSRYPDDHVLVKVFGCMATFNSFFPSERQMANCFVILRSEKYILNELKNYLVQ